MKPTKITAPVEGFSGTVAGVDFADGVGTCEDANALAYFQRQGYRIAGTKAADGGGADTPPADPGTTAPAAKAPAKKAAAKKAPAKPADKPATNRRRGKPADDQATSGEGTAGDAATDSTESAAGENPPA